MSKLSERQREDLLAIAGQRDEEVDLSDIPEIREVPADAVRTLQRPKKTELVIHLDDDIVQWLKGSGEYESRINAFLRELMSQCRQG